MRPNFYMLIGLPGSGKSTWAREHCKQGEIILSSDSIREELYGDEAIQGNPEEVFNLMQSRTLEYLNQGVSVYYDATNLTRKNRAGILHRIPRFVHCEAIIVWRDIGECILLDSKRQRTVGKEVIDRMVRRFQMPWYGEGFDVIRSEYKELSDSYRDLIVMKGNITEAMKIPHDNPHHQLNVYEHCMATKNYVMSLTDDSELITAMEYHDCGKPYCKTFTNTKGEPTDIAHYYDHQNVGAYLMCGHTTSIEIPLLINCHMMPFGIDKKFYDTLPTYLKAKIELMHEADLACP